MKNGTITNIAVLGSTGSIGTQTLDIISEHPDKFRASVLTAGRNWELLAKQARRFLPSTVVIAEAEAYPLLKEALKDLPIHVETGADAIADVAELPENDIVVTAMVGYSGLIPTVRAIKAGKRIALANKETLVVAGEVITALVSEYNAEIVPVDSEHSAIFQCLMGEKRSQATKIILTASGGPFRTKTVKELENVTVADALRHPNWSMGAKVTVDSASMMNKGFEMIEAKWLFNFEPAEIEVVVHPQSIVHSMVEFMDGSVKAQLGTPDMRIPISLALGYPDRIKSPRKSLSLSQYSNLTFEYPDYDKFPLLGLAFDAIEAGGNMPCILNAANEKAVATFLAGRMRFMDMPRFVSEVMEATPYISKVSLDDLIESNRIALSVAEEKIKKYIQ
ncbi:MAG: 1-deoxy-D-xylulose-5-phosphate reductoisomerase [Muribaculaceae bacterium]|nr:1-deoxy-D-xylulose-5-phosphate reductoisomerase [Muribaculaceae bacterium]